MTYRPDSQALEPAITKILDGIEEFQSAVRYRQEAEGEWKEDHLKDLCDAETELVSVKGNLFKLKRDNW